jgi:hypothetical protein
MRTPGRAFAFVAAVMAVGGACWAQSLAFSNAQVICRDGVPHTGALDATRPPRDLAVWGTGCAKGEGGPALSSEFVAPAVLRVYLAGYPSAPGNGLRLVSQGEHGALTFRPIEDPGLLWEPFEFSIPASWAG